METHRKILCTIYGAMYVISCSAQLITWLGMKISTTDTGFVTAPMPDLRPQSQHKLLDCAPPTISLQLLPCLWMWVSFFGGFQHPPVNGCSTASWFPCFCRRMWAHILPLCHLEPISKHRILTIIKKTPIEELEMRERQGDRKEEESGCRIYQNIKKIN